ncbi:type VI secretion protein [Massilia sp. JS1662]|nr:type VI secretion system protein TssA [Massilia sp. JS1662]KGF81116.1 type VI secretion protein [Massilia sp. JS1662]
MLNLERLLAPVSADKPCGDDLAFSSEIDAIVRARQADDPSLEQGAWVTELKEADWKFVGRECAQLIEKRSKDLQLAVWLAEASVQTAGVRALADSLLLTAMLCERYWDGLYPLPDEDGVERRIGNLAWLAARIAPWLCAVPLTDGADGHALRDFDAARMQGNDALAKLEGARQRTSQTFYTNLMRDCEHCADAIDRLEKSVDAAVGADGPSFSAARSGLESLVLFIKPALKEAVPVTADVVVAVPMQASAQEGPLQSRAQALAQLRAVADYFRRTEPHSPVAYLADKAAHWGEQPLHVWLRSVVKDDAAFAHIEEMLGVGMRPS